MATLDNFVQEIENRVNAYTDEVKTKLEKELDLTAQKIIDYIQMHAPRSGQAGAFADSFVVTPNGEGINKTLTIYSKARGRLTHLLEFGFTHRGGKFVAPRPFMRPAFDLFSREMLEAMRAIIEGRSL